MATQTVKMFHCDAEGCTIETKMDELDERGYYHIEVRVTRVLGPDKSIEVMRCDQDLCHYDVVWALPEMSTAIREDKAQASKDYEDRRQCEREAEATRGSQS